MAATSTIFPGLPAGPNGCGRRGDGVVAGVTVIMPGIVHTEAHPPRAADDMSRRSSCCRPWFAAMGKEPARYLYDKDVECDPPEALP